jgi:hypothetical protein
MLLRSSGVVKLSRHGGWCERKFYTLLVRGAPVLNLGVLYVTLDLTLSQWWTDDDDSLITHASVLSVSVLSVI